MFTEFLRMVSDPTVPESPYLGELEELEPLRDSITSQSINPSEVLSVFP